jgi:hypothetical protein
MSSALLATPWRAQSVVWMHGLFDGVAKVIALEEKLGKLESEL